MTEHNPKSRPAFEPRQGSRGFWAGGWVDRAALARAMDQQHARGALGWRVHAWLGVLVCLCAGLPMVFVELAAAPLVLWCLVRAPRAWRCWAWALAQPWAPLMIAWSAWWSASVLWSPDRAQGVDELDTLRWALAGLLLFPVLDARRGLIVALMLGLLAGNASQLVHAIGLWLDVPALTFGRAPGRVSGWWRPVVGGSLLVAALGLHLPGALHGRGRTRGLSLLALGVTAGGIIATGTRGAWLAGAALVGLALLHAAWTGRRRGTALVAGAAALLVIAGALLVLPTSAERVRRGSAEVRDALLERRFTTDTGARLLMNWWAVEAFADRPLTGVGAGGYRAWAHANLERRGIDPGTRWTHDHAHHALLHLASTQGLVGLALGVAVGLAALRGGLFRPDPPFTHPIDRGPGWALVGLLLVGTFDSVQINTQTGGLLFLLMGLCPVVRPGERGRPGAITSGPVIASGPGQSSTRTNS